MSEVKQGFPNNYKPVGVTRIELPFCDDFDPDTPNTLYTFEVDNRYKDFRITTSDGQIGVVIDDTFYPVDMTLVNTSAHKLLDVYES